MITPDHLRALVARGEQYDVELLGEEREPLGDEALVETVVCMANGRGGVIVIGVEDDGRPTGARARHGQYTDATRLEALIAGRTVPACPVECSVTRLDGVEVVVIEIPSNRPVTSTADGVYRRRAMDSHGRPRCLPFLYHEIQSREAERGRLDPSAQVVPEARWEDLDPLEIERVRQTIARNPGRADASLLALPDPELVRALGLAEGRDGVEGVRLAGLLMVGREEALRRLVPAHEVAFQVLTGTRISSNEFFRGPLVRVAEEVATRFAARNEEDEIEVGHVRAGIPTYSPSGFREALHNALIHRDYGSLGAVHVQWRAAEIEISNPGGLPEDVRLDNLLVAAPRPRNPVLADAFRRIGLVERTGRGIDTIFEGQLRFGRPAPDYSRSTTATVQLVLPGGPADVPLARFFIERDVPGRRLTVDEMLVVNEVAREGRTDVARVSSLTQRSATSAGAVLERLVEAGVLEEREERREAWFSLTAPVARTLSLGVPAPALAAAAGPEEHERIILAVVDADGKITRSQAAELCGLEPREARAVLERLVKRGELVVQGERRGAHYARATGVMTGRS
ncbi:MAG TPA: ATP-binding protein [Gemmatimonadales bacterium]